MNILQDLREYISKREIKDKHGTLDQLNPLSKNDPSRADVRNRVAHPVNPRSADLFGGQQKQGVM